jgi:hypothetical protein
MAASSQLLQRQLLDLLIDGPSSFAALFGALVRHYGYGPGLGVDTALDALSMMERKGSVRARKMTERGIFRDPTDEDRANARERYRAWLPGAAAEDLSLDEVGLWYEIEHKGRSEWKRWSKEEEDQSRRRWVLDDVAHAHTILIQAEGVKAAEEALSGWLSSNPSIELVEDSKTIEPLHEFEMRDRTVVSNGVRLVCRYRRRPSATDSTTH